MPEICQPRCEWRRTQLDENDPPTDLDWCGFDGDGYIGIVLVASCCRDAAYVAIMSLIPVRETICEFKNDAGDVAHAKVSLAAV